MLQFEENNPLFERESMDTMYVTFLLNIAMLLDTDIYSRLPNKALQQKK